MAATNECLKRKAEYNVSHAMFSLFTTVSPYDLPHKGTLGRFVKNTLTQARVNTIFF